MSLSYWDVCTEYCCCCLSKGEEKFGRPLVFHSSTSSMTEIPESLSDAVVPPISAIAFHFPQKGLEYSPHERLLADTEGDKPDKPTMLKDGSYHSFRLSQSLDLDSATLHHRVHQSLSATLPAAKSQQNLVPLRSFSYGHLPPIMDQPHRMPPPDHPRLDCPVLRFSVYYDLQCRSLYVHLQRACNLPTKSKRVIVNSYVKLYLEPSRDEVYQSQIKEHDLNPVFDKMFKFRNLATDQVKQQTIVFRVFNYARYTKSSYIGSVVFPLQKEDLLGETHTVVIDENPKTLKRANYGDLLLSLQYEPQQSQLQGTVMKITNLQKQDLAGLADPYVKIYLEHKGCYAGKWKSTIKKKTLSPIYNEAFRFGISKMRLEDITLKVIVMNYDRFSYNDIIGSIAIGNSLDHSSGERHWKEVISSSNSPVTAWHSILPPPKTAMLKRLSQQEISPVTSPLKIKPRHFSTPAS